jgi:hypothetical protein
MRPGTLAAMLERVAHGLAAGAVGTTALNAVTYLDMAARGRPSSSVPAGAAERLAGQAGVGLGAGDVRENRKEGIGALLGFATGVGAGAVLGVVGPVLRRLPVAVGGPLLGLGVMAATDGANAALGTSDPSTWSAADWASDVVPHLAYGVAAAWAFDALED